MEIYLEIEWNETWQPIQLKHADVDECSYLYLLSVNYVRSSPFSNFHAKKPLRSVSLYWYANSLWPEIEWQKREGKKIHLSDAVLWVICFFLKRGIQFWYVESDMAQNQEVKQKAIDRKIMKSLNTYENKYPSATMHQEGNEME